MENEYEDNQNIECDPVDEDFEENEDSDFDGEPNDEILERQELEDFAQDGEFENHIPDDFDY